MARLEEMKSAVVAVAAKAGFPRCLVTVEPTGLLLRCLVADGDPPVFEFWIRRDDGSSPCFARSGGRMVGYRGGSAPESALKMMASITRLLAAGSSDCKRAMGKGTTSSPETSNGTTSSPETSNGTTSPPEISDHDYPRSERLSLLYGGNQFEIRLTLKCDECCLFCNSWNEALNVVNSLDEAFEAMSSARSAGAQRLVITGGEPLLVPWLAEVVNNGRSIGFRYITVQTNGALLTSGPVLEAVGKAWPDEILVSLQAANSRTMKLITGRNRFEEKIAGIRLAMSAGLRISINHVVCRQNLGELVEFVDLLSGLHPLRPHLVAFSVVAPTGLAWDNRLDTIPRYSQVAQPLLNALKLAAGREIPVVHSEYCGLPTCIEPSLREFAEPWNPERPLHVPPDKVKFATCGSCQWDDRCSGVFRRYLELHGSSEFQERRD